MAPNHLNYALPTPRPQRRPRLFRAATTIAILITILSLLTVDVRRTVMSMDAVTGSVSLNSAWIFGTSSARTDVSPLETRLKSAGITWTPTWRYLNGASRNIVGIRTRNGCGSAPPIYQLHGTILKDFVAAATDDELRQFVKVMQSGTDAEQNAAIESAAEKAFRQMSAAPPSN